MKSKLLSIGFVLFLVVSCTEDKGSAPEITDVTILKGGNPTTSLASGDTFAFRIVAKDKDNDIRSIRFYRYESPIATAYNYGIEGIQFYTVHEYGVTYLYPAPNFFYTILAEPGQTLVFRFYLRDYEGNMTEEYPVTITIE